MKVDIVGIVEGLIEASQKIEDIHKAGGISKEVCNDLQRHIRGMIDRISPQDESVRENAYEDA